MAFEGINWKWIKRPFEGPWGLTSPYNWAEEVTKKWKLPKKVELHDSTFRDGEQSILGAPFQKKDYIDIACAMSDWGVHRFEFMPATSKETQEAAKEISKMGLKAEMWGFCRARRDDIELAIDVGCKGVTIEMSAHGYLTGTARWKPEQMVQMSKDTTKIAKDAGLRVITFHPSSTTDPYEELSAYIMRVTEDLKYPDGYCPVDTGSSCTPEGTAFFTDIYRALLPDLWMECHCHNRNGLGVANALTAIAHGVQGVEGEMLGFTNPPLQEVAANLYQMYGIDLGIKWEKTREVCELIAERAKIPIEVQRPLIGRRLGYRQAGISHHGALDALKEMEEKLKRGEQVVPRPRRRGMDRFLGIPTRISIGKQSGRWTINYKLWCMGIPEVSYPDQCAAILDKLKRICVEKKQPEVTDEQFLKAYEEVIGHPPLPPKQRKIPEVMKRGLGPNWV